MFAGVFVEETIGELLACAVRNDLFLKLLFVNDETSVLGAWLAGQSLRSFIDMHSRPTLRGHWGPKIGTATDYTTALGSREVQ